MNMLSEIIGNLLLITGSVFLFSAGLGVLRMPDTYNRIQTGTKATTLGTILLLIGLAFLHPGWTLKLIILIFFVMLTNPVSSHALARAAHTIGIFKADSTVIDQLTDSNNEVASNVDNTGTKEDAVDKSNVDENSIDENNVRETAK